MLKFALNPHTIPFCAPYRDSVFAQARSVFGAIAKYIADEGRNPQLFFHATKNKVMLCDDGLSLVDLCNSQKVADRNFADFMSRLLDRQIAVVNNSDLPVCLLRLGDNTQYKNDILLRFACHNDALLLSLVIPENAFWERAKIPYELRYDGGDVKKETLLNLYADDLTSLPSRKNCFSLDDEHGFQKTHITFNGANVFREVRTNWYWYRDTLHRDHYEVFSRHKIHIGIADLSGKVDRTKADSSRRLSM